MFKNIYYRHGKIYLWENIDGKTVKTVFDHPREVYYTSNESDCGMVDIFGTPVKKSIIESHDQLESLKGLGRVCESDINEATKFLSKKYLNENVKVDSSVYNIGYFDIEAPGEKFSEAEDAEYPINLITIVSSKTGKIYTFGTEPYTGKSDLVKFYCHCVDEKTLLETFISFFRKAKFDILTGWNICKNDQLGIKGWDMLYLVNRCKKNEIDFNSMSQVNYAEVSERGDVNIAGVSILDYLALYKKFDRTQLENYMLDTVGKYVVGEGKTTFEGSISDLHKRDWNLFVEYNIQDTMLVKKIDEKLHCIDTAINFSVNALIPIEQTLSTIPVITGYILRYLHQHKMVLPNRKENIVTQEIVGGYCYAKIGPHKHCASWDAESLYPHLIMFYNISPETLVVNPETVTDNLIKSPVPGVYFRKDVPGIFAEIVRGLFADRKKFKQKQKALEALNNGMSESDVMKKMKLEQSFIDEIKLEVERDKVTPYYYYVQQNIRKIILNSFYGVTNSPYFHFYDPNIAETITKGGQKIIKHFSSRLDTFMENAYGEGGVVLVDTDSCFLSFDNVIKKKGVEIKTYDDYINFVNKFESEELQGWIAKILQEFADEHGTKNVFYFKKEKVILDMIVLTKKHYVARYVENEGVRYNEPQFNYTGVEVVRTDTPVFCRTALKEVIGMIFDEYFSTGVSDKVNNFIGLIREKYEKTDINKLASSSGVKHIRKYSFTQVEMEALGFPKYKTKAPVYVKAAINHNFLLRKYKLPLVPIYDNTKIKWFYVKKDNEINADVIGYVGTFPKEFDGIFKLDRDLQWEKTFQNKIDGFYEVLGWGNVTLNKTETEDMFEY
jgi:DNA polymerase elongation subunit (family B)